MAPVYWSVLVMSLNQHILGSSGQEDSLEEAHLRVAHRTSSTEQFPLFAVT
jgi:hypothetical protein